MGVGRPSAGKNRRGSKEKHGPAANCGPSAPGCKAGGAALHGCVKVYPVNSAPQRTIRGATRMGCASAHMVYFSQALSQPGFDRTEEVLELILLVNGDFFDLKSHGLLQQVCQRLQAGSRRFFRQGMTHMKVLNLQSLTGAALIDGVLTKSHRLCSVSFVNCPQVGDLAVNFLVELESSSLQNVTILECPFVSSKSVAAVVMRSASLEVLNTDVTPVFPLLESLHYAAHDESRSCQLKELSLRGEMAQSDNALFWGISGHLIGLKKLALDQFWLPALTNLFQPHNLVRPDDIALTCHLPGVSSILRREFSLQQLLREFARNFRAPRAARVRLSGFLAIDDVLSTIAQDCSQTLLSLKIGELGQCSTLKTIGDHCPMLEELYVPGCTRLGDTGLHAVVTRCHRLRTLHVNDCLGVSRATICHLTENCPLLESLNLGSCVLIDNAALAALNLPSLTALDVSHCHLISDTGLKAACRTLPKLQSLSLGGCKNLTNEGVLAIAKWTTRLRSLDLSWCLLLTLFSLEEIVVECKLLGALYLYGFECQIPTGEAEVLASKSTARLKLYLQDNTFTGRGIKLSRTNPRLLALSHRSAKPNPRRRGNKLRAKLSKNELALLDEGLA